MSNQDEIVPVPATMEKFFGGRGDMLRPTAETVAQLVQQVPAGKIVTLEMLRNKLAQDFQVFTACPAATVKALKLAATERPDLGYWRVVNKKGELIARLPGGIEGQQAALEQEGLAVDRTKKTPKVINFNNHAHQLK